MKLTEEEITALKTIVDHFESEDQSARDRQIRTWRRLKLMWDGFQRVWYSEVAHDWRIYDEQQDNDPNAQDYYNKPINVFRAYLESIIAALSITIPPIICYPDDADSALDLLTAKAGNKIGELISRHNDVSLLWLHALYIYVTEGMVACYNYTREDDSYGTYEEPKYEEATEQHGVATCPNCGGPIDEQLIGNEKDEFDPGDDDINIKNAMNMGKELCPNCLAQVDPQFAVSKVIVTRLVGVTNKPKARQCLEVYGGLYVKVANYAMKQEDTPYLMFSYETNYMIARSHYPNIRNKIKPGMGHPGEPYARWGRNNPQYWGEYPTDSVTCRNTWLRPAAFEYLEDEEMCKKLKKKLPDGCKVIFIEDEFAEACNESLDDHWTLTNNPLSDYLYFDPIGLLLTSIQEITNDLVSLTLQTVEHGIGQTFADPKVLNFKAYSEMETIPGGIYPATPQSGKTIKDGFMELRTATLGQEVMPFAAEIQSLGQLVSGALPSLYGGAPQGGRNTASQYAMQKGQSMQRLGNTWKMFTIWWKNIYSKAIPAYIKTVQEDEKFVQKDAAGNFVNVLIKKGELEGKIGSIELESNENLPMTWNQRREVIMQLAQNQNPEMMAFLAHPENLPLFYEALGIADFYVPGEDDRAKQYDEIKQLLASQPLPNPNMPPPGSPMIPGVPPPPPEVPSVEVDQEMDNHAIEFAICQKWAISEAGRQAKVDNPDGYKNVLLHAVMHKQLIPPPPPPPDAKAPGKKPKVNMSHPVGDKHANQLH